MKLELLRSNVQEVLGFPAPWARDPAFSYNDTHKYPFNPSLKRPKHYAKQDAAITEDGTDLVPLRVQAAPGLKEEKKFHLGKTLH